MYSRAPIPDNERTLGWLTTCAVSRFSASTCKTISILLSSNRKKTRTCLSFIEKFLRETQRYEVYHYLLTTIIANHSSQLWKVLLEVARDERSPEKIELLLSALTLVQHNPAIEKLIRELHQKSKSIATTPEA